LSGNLKRCVISTLLIIGLPSSATRASHLPEKFENEVPDADEGHEAEAPVVIERKLANAAD
jgi:hypothetical protein